MRQHVLVIVAASLALSACGPRFKAYTECRQEHPYTVGQTINNNFGLIGALANLSDPTFIATNNAVDACVAQKTAAQPQ
jgi:hypothetical protein